MSVLLKVTTAQRRQHAATRTAALSVSVKEISLAMDAAVFCPATKKRLPPERNHQGSLHVQVSMQLQCVAS